MGEFGITTDDTLRETARHGSDRYPFQYYLEDIWAFDFHRIDWHWHHELEMVYVREGAARCSVGTELIELSAGSGLFINTGVLHRFEASGSTILPNIVFSPALLAPEDSLLYDKYLRPVMESAASCQILTPDVPWQNDALRLLREVFSAQDDRDTSELATVSHLMALWQTLYEHMALAQGAASSARGLNYRQARLRLMMQFIQEQYGGKIALREIAASASVGESTASHIFQSGIHMSPVAYLIQYRLSQAAKRLGSTQATVASIAEEAGFSNAGYFCRKSRQIYRMTPNEYRRMRWNPSNP